MTPKNWNYLPFRFYTHGVLLRTVFFVLILVRHDWATQRDILSDCTLHWFEGSVLMLCWLTPLLGSSVFGSDTLTSLTEDKHIVRVH